MMQRCRKLAALQVPAVARLQDAAGQRKCRQPGRRAPGESGRWGGGRADVHLPVPAGHRGRHGLPALPGHPALRPQGKILLPYSEVTLPSGNPTPALRPRGTPARAGGRTRALAERRHRRRLGARCAEGAVTGSNQGLGPGPRALLARCRGMRTSACPDRLAFGARPNARAPPCCRSAWAVPRRRRRTCCCGPWRRARTTRAAASARWRPDAGCCWHGGAGLHERLTGSCEKPSCGRMQSAGSKPETTVAVPAACCCIKV